MKTSKLQGTFRVLVRAAGGAIISVSDGSTYIVRPGITADEYTFKKVESNEVHTTDTWNKQCSCKGFKNGYLCRHLRILSAMQSRNIV